MAIAIAEEGHNFASVCECACEYALNAQISSKSDFGKLYDNGK